MSLLRPTRVAGAVERLDEPGNQVRALDESLGHVAAVNRWLGGWRSILVHLPELLPATGPARVLDLGAGSGEGATVVARWARALGREVFVTAADSNPQMLEVARRRTAGFPEIRVEPADALALPYPDGAFHAVLLTLTLHHFEGEAAVRVLRELGRVARGGMIVSDLDRTWANYIGGKLLSWTLWRGNPITRHDAPLSVLRSYSTSELEELARQARLNGARVVRHPFQRLVLLARGGSSG